MNREPSEPARDCHNCNIVGCPGCNEDLRRQFGEVLRRWGLLDEVNSPKDAEAFAVTDLLSAASAETGRLREKHKASLRRADKVNNELMEEVQRYAIGAERPVLWSVYNRMHSRASHAEAALNRVGRIARRLAAHAAGFKDVLDASDHGPWGRTVGADIAELIEALADQDVAIPRGTRQQSKEADADRIVAYRSPLPGALSVYCIRHIGELGASAIPLASEDLPDGGLCVDCGVDVLIPQEAQE